jgi:GH24 family phage-related lysozyme (muramidase)
MGVRAVSPAGLAIIKEFEGFVPHPYRDSVGVWTIGYGETQGIGPSSPNVTERQASQHLKRRVDKDYAPAVYDASRNLTQNQFDALVSFVYNCGTGALSRSTTIGRDLRAGKLETVADDLLSWSKAGGRTLPGLLRRRQEERALFLKQPPVLEGYRDDEKAWIREYDKLKKAKRGLARRKELQALMTRRRKWIWKQAQKHGWDSDHRAARYKSLFVRSR